MFFKRINQQNYKRWTALCVYIISRVWTHLHGLAYSRQGTEFCVCITFCRVWHGDSHQTRLLLLLMLQWNVNNQWTFCNEKRSIEFTIPSLHRVLLLWWQMFWKSDIVGSWLLKDRERSLLPLLSLHRLCLVCWRIYKEQISWVPLPVHKKVWNHQNAMEEQYITIYGLSYDPIL